MTCSAVDTVELEKSRRQVFLALFAALAIALHAAETLLPTPLPWFRIGIANILTLTALVLFGPRAAWGVAIIRIGLGSLLLGRFLTPGFFLACGGGLLAVAAMSLAYWWGRRWFSPIGLSILGAVGHVTGQVAVASWLLQHTVVWSIYPVLFLIAILTGGVNGFVANGLIASLRRHPAFAKS